MEIRNKIKKLREEKGLSTYKLAEIITNNGFKISQSAISKIENGNKKIDVPTLTNIAIALGCTLNDLIEDDENMRALVLKQGALSASCLFPYDGDDNSWIIQNLDPSQREEYIKMSQNYLKLKDHISVRDNQLSLLAAFVKTIAEDFIELPKDNIDDFSMSVASWLIEYVEMATKAKIKEIIEKNIPYEKR